MENLAGNNGTNSNLENGDLFDEDTGEHLATIDLKSTAKMIEDDSQTIPASLSLFFNGFWYVYKIDSRYEEEKEETSSEIAP